MFYHASQLVKLYPFDDIYLGILAHFLRIHASHNDGFLFWTRQVSHDEWLNGKVDNLLFLVNRLVKVTAAHGFDPQKLEEQFPLVRFAVPG